MPTRDAMWNRLGEPVDVLVIGGGINGAGIARDAARRGLSVALVEMRDLAFGTSSRSSKLVHGGLRYLEQFAFSLVFEAVSERRVLLDIAPHIVNPLGFLFPVYSHSRTGLLKLNAGMWLYDGLSLFRSPKKRRTLKPKEVATEEPTLNTHDLRGAPLYYDCSTDDARLTLETALDAAIAGATVATYAKVVGFVHDDDGRLRGAEVVCGLTGARRVVRADAVVNATGPWTDLTIRLGTGTAARDLLRPTKGTHIVVRRDVLPVNNAVVVIHPGDGRVLFAIPWEEHTYLGTTDTDNEGDPADVYASAEDVRYIVDAARAYFPAHPIHPDEIVSTWSGLRPLVAEHDPRELGDADRAAAPDQGAEAGPGLSASQVSREHQIVVGPDGLITIAGGKLTTYRLMSKEVVDKATQLLRLSRGRTAPQDDPRTGEIPLPGAVGWPEDDDHDRVADRVLAAGDGTIDYDTARLLTNTYGMRAIDVATRAKAEPALATRLVPGRPEILAQVDWSVHEELAATVEDVLKQRTQLYYRAPDQGLECLDVVGERMQTLLGWSAAERARHIESYRQEVAASRAWRKGFAVSSPD